MTYFILIQGVHKATTSIKQRAFKKVSIDDA